MELINSPRDGFCENSGTVFVVVLKSASSKNLIYCEKCVSLALALMVGHQILLFHSKWCWKKLKKMFVDQNITHKNIE